MADSITTKNPATQTATVAKTNTPVKAKNPKDILFEQISISENYLNEGLSSEEDNFSFGGTIGRNLFLGSLGTVSAFQEVSQHYDKKGNYSLGLEEQLMFPEIEYDKIDQVRGMDISIVTTAKTQEEGLSLLKEFGLPFK